MPRTKRLIPILGALHIICRGNNRQNIFNSSEDKRKYYSLLFELREENNITIFHYCLMDNHVHLIIWLGENSSLSRFMKQVNLTYFHYFKKVYGYYGHLWQDRFKGNLIGEDSYLLQCGKYIELNPVRARLVSQPEDYRFSSYNHYAYGKDDQLISKSPAYLGLSDNAEERKNQYKSFVIDEAFINEGWFQRLRYIGSDSFRRKMQEYYQIRNENLKRGRPRKLEK